jgi:sulfur-oxidizing protein SoxY
MAAAIGLWRPSLAAAAPWNAKAFEAQAIADALQELGLTAAKESADIVLKAPEIAENGAQVPIEISTIIPNVEDIYIFVDKNPQPFAGSFRFMNGAQPFVVSRIKMAETSPVRVIVRAGNAQFITSREVKVTIGGCGE